MKILVIAAHPDDEVLGCGATVARMVQDGHEAFAVILGEGVTSRDDSRNAGKRKKELSALKSDIQKANKVIGCKDVFVYDFPDNRFDSVPMLDIVKTIERAKNKVRPDIIFTHYANDLNIDHQITFKAVLTATRPMASETVKEVYSFYVPSSTEWNFPLSFAPDTFHDVTNTLYLKLQAMQKYRSELRQFPHPRSLEGITLTSSYWGMNMGMKYAEPFKCIRAIK